MKEREENSKETCSTNGCACAANYIWGGIAVILFIIAITMMFGN